MPEKGGLSVGRLILVPAVITLAVSLLRLVGELNGWSPLLFNRAAGGGGALVGIVWLVFVFAFYFAWKLVQAGEGPSGRFRPLGFSLLGIAIAFAIGFGANAAQLSLPASFGVFVAASLVALFVSMQGWPALGRTLLAYGLAARIPVAVIMLLAILGNWGTHYDVAPPNFPAMGPIAKWAMIGLLPQLTVWIGFTVAVGMLCGGLLVALRPHRVAATA
jgi:hypothetical protein